MKNKNWSVSILTARQSLQSKNFWRREISAHLRPILRVWSDFICQQAKLDQKLVRQFQQAESALDQISLIKKNKPELDFWLFTQEVMEPFLESIDNKE